MRRKENIEEKINLDLGLRYENKRNSYEKTGGLEKK